MTEPSAFSTTNLADMLGNRPRVLGKSRQEWLTWALYHSPIFLVVAVMLPRLISPQFGLFDDGVTISNAQEIAQGTWNAGWEAATGRYRPAYWLYYGLVYLIAGENPFGFFLAHTILLAGITLLLMSLVRSAGGSSLQTVSTGLLFVLSGPVIENFYTLSKGEPLQLFWILVALKAVSLVSGSHNAWKKWGLFFVTVTGLLFATASKETTLIMIPVSLAWLFFGWLFNNRKVRNFDVIARFAFMMAALLAAAIFYYLRSRSVPVGLTGGGYTSMYDFSLSAISASAFRWTGWLMRDLPYLFPLAVFAMVWGVANKKISQCRLAIDSLIWCGAWMAIYLPWIFTVEYYMLPLFAGATVLGGLLLDVAARQVVGVNKAMRGFSAFCLVLAVLALSISLMNNVSNARLQLAVDAANAEMLEVVAMQSPAGGKVYVNLPANNEYVYEIELHLSRLHQRPDLEVSSFRFQRAEPGDAKNLSYLVVSPEIENQPLLSVRLGLYEEGARHWNSSLKSFLGKNTEPVFVAERSFRLSSVDFLRVFCPLFGHRNYCKEPYLVNDRRMLVYRWNVYQVHGSTTGRALPGVFKDGAWTLQLPDGSLKSLVFGLPGDLPLSGDWNGDGFTGLGVYRESDLTRYFDVNLDGRDDITFKFEGMQAGDMPLVGDWDGDGIDTPGFFRPPDTTWHLRNSLVTGSADLPILQAGLSTDLPLTGDWNGDGRATIGVYRPANGEVDLEDTLDAGLQGIDFMLSANVDPVAADWNGRGLATLAEVSEGEWMLKFGNCACPPSNEARPFSFDAPGSIPVAGFWR